MNKYLIHYEKIFLFLILFLLWGNLETFKKTKSLEIPSQDKVLSNTSNDELNNILCRINENPSHIFGIDFSHYSGKVDWEMLSHEQKIFFVILRATMGVSDVDFKYCENIEIARSNDFVVGAYHYFRSGESGYDQAINYMNTVSLKSYDFIPILDIEYKRWKVSPNDLRKELLLWLKTVENDIGVKPMVYTNLNFYNRYIKNHSEFDTYPLWIAAYSPKRKKHVMNFAYIHQFSDKVLINGIERKVDGNYIKKEKFLQVLIP